MSLVYPLRDLAPWLLATATIAAYSDSRHGPSISDDYTYIVANEGLRQLWPLT